MRGWLAFAALAVLVAASGGGWWLGYRAGERAAEARHAAALRAKQDEISSLGDEVAQLAQTLEQERRARSAVAREVEDEARNDPDGARPGIGPDGLRRLERRWGAR